MSDNALLDMLADEIRELRRRVDELYNVEHPLSDYGTYTPTLTNVANTDGRTAYACQYLRFGSMVVVSGRIDIDATAAVQTTVGVSLPIASNLAASNQCGGVLFATGTASLGGAIEGDPINDRAQISYVSTVTTNQAFHFIFAYRIL